MKHELTRRDFIATTAVGAAALAVGCVADTTGNEPPDGSTDGMAPDGPLPDGPTPECLETEDNLLGPAYVEGAPMREDGNLNVLNWPGTSLTISGHVLGPDCKTPIPGAVLDIWQADDSGCYNGSPIGCDPVDPAWPLRGKVAADSDGRYNFLTIYPGLYPGRTRHIHAIIRAPGYRTLTTQIYFAGEPENANDGLIEPELIIELANVNGALSGVFNIVLARA